MGASNLKLVLISLTWDYTTFHSFFSVFKKKKKISKFSVCDCLAKWLIMLGLMDLRWPEGLLALQLVGVTTLVLLTIHLTDLQCNNSSWYISNSCVSMAALSALGLVDVMYICHDEDWWILLHCSGCQIILQAFDMFVHSHCILHVKC